MNLDELQSVQNRERQASDLQNLRPSFYQEAAEFVRDLREKRQRVVREEGLDSREFDRLSNDIETAERTVESVYERRVGKVVKMASIAAADMPTEDEGLTAEERDMFKTLVEDIRTNRERVLSSLGPAEDATAGSADAGKDTASGGQPGEGVTGDTDAATRGPAGTEPAGMASESRPDSRPDTVESNNRPDTAGSDPRRLRSAEADPRPDPEGAEPLPGHDPERELSRSAGEETTASEIERTTVHITEDVGEILGVDQRAYHLAREDVVTLPEANAGPLIEQGAAKRID